MKSVKLPWRNISPIAATIHHATEDEFAELSRSVKVESLFVEQVLLMIERWVKFAEERLSRWGDKMFHLSRKRRHV